MRENSVPFICPLTRMYLPSLSLIVWERVKGGAFENEDGNPSLFVICISKKKGRVITVQEGRVKALWEVGLLD